MKGGVSPFISDQRVPPDKGIPDSKRIERSIQEDLKFINSPKNFNKENDSPSPMDFEKYFEKNFRKQKNERFK